MATQTNNYTTSMFFSSSSSVVTASENTFSNFYGNQRGGVYYLDSITFNDE